MALSTGKKPHKVKDLRGKVYSSTNYRILLNHELVLEHALIYLRATGNSTLSLQDLFDECMAISINYLAKKKNIPIPAYLLGENAPATPVATIEQTAG